MLYAVIAHTGIKHHSGNFHRPFRERWLEEEPAVVNGYKETMNIAREGKRALAEEFDEFDPYAQGVTVEYLKEQDANSKIG